MFERLANSRPVRVLTSLKIPVVCLALLIILVFWGTIYQKGFGLYAAQQRFFYSWCFLILGVIPFPGTQGVLWVFFASLVTSAIFKLKYTWAKAGLIMSHYGILLFFVTAFASFHVSHHSSLQLYEGEASNVSSDYNDWELSVWEDGKPLRGGAEIAVTAFDADRFRQGGVLDISEYGASIEVIEYHPHCRAEGGTPREGWVSDSGIGSLAGLGRRADPGEHTPGGVFRILGKDGTESTRIIYSLDRTPARVEVGGRQLHVALRRARYELPFTIRLKDFERRLHPGTQMPRSFRSVVDVVTMGAERQVEISMNKPLRHKSFTLFQASFTMDERGSVLAVVENPSRWLPYIATLVTVGGLMIHFLAVLVQSLRPRTPRAVLS